MKNYFQKILSLFIEYDYSKQTTQHFYRWVTDSEHEEEKDKAFRELYFESRKRKNAPDLEKSLERWRVNNNIRPNQSLKNYQNKSFMRLWQSVAIVFLIVSISLGYLLSKVETNTTDLVQQFIPTTQMKTFLLPDGSQVQINSRSILLYPKLFTGKNREVF